MADKESKFECPVDKVLMQRAIRENPNKENLYPVQVNSLKELLARQKTLRETDSTLLTEIKKQIKLAETMERDL